MAGLHPHTFGAKSVLLAIPVKIEITGLPTLLSYFMSDFSTAFKVLMILFPWLGMMGNQENYYDPLIIDSDYIQYLLSIKVLICIKPTRKTTDLTCYF
jgi:hypothetical protein